MGAVDLAALAGNGQVQITPWVVELAGQVRVRRDPSGMRILEVIHPSGVLAARIVLDPINAASIARELSPIGETPAGPDGLSVDT
jgi:hypothetical protein